MMDERRQKAGRDFMTGVISIEQYRATLAGVYPDTPIATMTHSQLDWAVGLAVGWQEIRTPVRDGYESISNPPPYSTSLDACAQAEAALRRNADAWRRYSTELMRACLFYPEMPTAASLDRVIMADAETRSRAMLKALEGGR